jgi:hypothetical protein
MKKPFEKGGDDTNQVRSEFCLKIHTDQFCKIGHIFQNIHRIKLRCYKKILDTWNYIVVNFQFNLSFRTYYLKFSNFILFWNIHRQHVLYWLFFTKSVQTCHVLILDSKGRFNEAYLCPKLVCGLGLQGFLANVAWINWRIGVLSFLRYVWQLEAI